MYTKAEGKALLRKQLEPLVKFARYMTCTDPHCEICEERLGGALDEAVEYVLIVLDLDWIEKPPGTEGAVLTGHREDETGELLVEVE